MGQSHIPCPNWLDWDVLQQDSSAPLPPRHQSEWILPGWFYFGRAQDVEHDASLSLEGPVIQHQVQQVRLWSLVCLVLPFSFKANPPMYLFVSQACTQNSVILSSRFKSVWKACLKPIGCFDIYVSRLSQIVGPIKQTKQTHKLEKRDWKLAVGQQMDRDMWLNQAKEGTCRKDIQPKGRQRTKLIVLFAL